MRSARLSSVLGLSWVHRSSRYRRPAQLHLLGPDSVVPPLSVFPAMLSLFSSSSWNCLFARDKSQQSPSLTPPRHPPHTQALLLEWEAAASKVSLKPLRPFVRRVLRTGIEYRDTNQKEALQTTSVLRQELLPVYVLDIGFQQREIRSPVFAAPLLVEHRTPENFYTQRCPYFAQICRELPEPILLRAILLATGQDHITDANQIQRGPLSAQEFHELTTLDIHSAELKALELRHVGGGADDIERVDCLLYLRLGDVRLPLLYRLRMVERQETETRSQGSQQREGVPSVLQHLC